MEKASIDIHTDRVIGGRNPMVFGHFIEHFHRQVYGGLYDPGSPLSDRKGFRADVVQALRKIKAPVIRWPGGCFASSYHWKHGVGTRVPVYDKSWRTGEPNTFGTDEFIAFCRTADAEPYICANAGTGTPEEMSDWVEYCNLDGAGPYAAMRAANGSRRPHKVKYWSIGNENYGEWEIGVKSAAGFAQYVREAAVMMKRVDPSIEVFAPVSHDPDWITELLKTAGQFIDWISIHYYWGDGATPYDWCVTRSLSTEEILSRVEQVLDTLGFRDKIRIAWDEWNLRLWELGAFHALPPRAVDHADFDKNDDNAAYTMADALFCGRFLNTCLRHCRSLQMANYAPTVNTRGMIYTHDKGIVLRTTYHVFDLFVNHTGPAVLDATVKTPHYMVTEQMGIDVPVPYIDAVATHDPGRNTIHLSLLNFHRDRAIDTDVRVSGVSLAGEAEVRRLTGDTPDSFNDLGHPDRVSIIDESITAGAAGFTVTCPPHTVMAVTCHYK